ncbi:sensor domain-containing protein [Nocardia huaxiensis]|uniref:histidine kinase n=1 Tax=Nocardia huaxiensis TaxID=2755382 RepID=A0A7D6ZHN9_9NOCA|nr:sensor histidine kinase [Nocardia huaxiensis]QLY30787.1 sensor domain-containing protein [Nocardia huaxiensis]
MSDKAGDPTRILGDQSASTGEPTLILEAEGSGDDPTLTLRAEGGTGGDPTLAIDRPGSTSRRAGESALRTILLAPVRARAWKDLGYVIAAFVLGCAAVCYLFFAVGGGLYISIFLIGIPILAFVILGGRVWGHIYRWLARVLLDANLPEPPPFSPRRGFWGWLRSAFTDLTSWRALAYLVIQGILGVAAGYIVLTVVAMVVFIAISPIPWALFHPINVDDQGVEHHSLFQFGSWYIETWPSVLAFAAAGIVLCFALPWLLRALCLLHLLLSSLLLTPTDRDRRVTELQESRRAAVEDSAATLRRLERDLHDGTQARLVSIAMALGRAEERIAAGADASDLIAQARSGSKEALTELRELVRGIHPPALDLGLEAALETLAARCALPVELRVMLPHRPSQAIEAIAYFSVAELLTNAVKHSGADRVWVAVLPSGADSLAVSVRDNGHGGALQPIQPNGETVVAGGLSGLSARARAVDGSLLVDSPFGGPTVVTLVLPIAGPK